MGESKLEAQESISLLKDVIEHIYQIAKHYENECNVQSEKIKSLETENISLKSNVQSLEESLKQKDENFNTIIENIENNHEKMLSEIQCSKEKAEKIVVNYDKEIMKYLKTDDKLYEIQEELLKKLNILDKLSDKVSSLEQVEIKNNKENKLNEENMDIEEQNTNFGDRTKKEWAPGE